MSAGSPMPARNLSDVYVLVVEDNVPNFVLLARLLASLGIRNC